MELTALSEDDLKIFAQDVAIACRPGDCIALKGDLGAGKTSFARAFIRYLAGADIDVPSPTFSLVLPYDDLSPPVHHLDLYRIGDADELSELGLDEALETGIALVEWPERAADALPASSLVISIAVATHHDDMRDVVVSGGADIVARVQASLQARQFLSAQEAAYGERRTFSGDASTRLYETVTDRHAQRFLMIAPRQADGPPIRDGKPYSQLAHLAEDIVPFVVIASALRAHGFRAPRIDAYDLEPGYVLLEDLGRGGVLDADGAPIADRYQEASRCLAALHQCDWQPALSGAGSQHVLPHYDRDVFNIEAALLLDWYVPAETGREAGTAMRQDFTAIMDDLWAKLDQGRFTILLRDFHSPNIVHDGSKTGVNRIGLIDFQDALWGPAAYDLMSLVHDARVTVPDTLGQKLMADYCAQRAATEEAFDAEAFQMEAGICTVQRLCKILGIFHRLNRRDGKPAYLQHLPRIKSYFERTLSDNTPARAALAPLARWWSAAGLGSN